MIIQKRARQELDDSSSPVAASQTIRSDLRNIVHARALALNTRARTQWSYRKVCALILKYLSVSLRLRAEVARQRSAPRVHTSERGKSGGTI